MVTFSFKDYAVADLRLSRHKKRHQSIYHGGPVLGLVEAQRVSIRLREGSSPAGQAVRVLASVLTPRLKERLTKDTAAKVDRSVGLVKASLSEKAEIETAAAVEAKTTAFIVYAPLLGRLHVGVGRNTRVSGMRSFYRAEVNPLDLNRLVDRNTTVNTKDLGVGLRYRPAAVFLF